MLQDAAVGPGTARAQIGAGVAEVHASRGLPRCLIDCHMLVGLNERDAFCELLLKLL